MRFIDEARVKVKAGDGGPGIVAWRREKFVPMGGPAGGNGGRGGDVIFVAKEGMTSLLDIKAQTLINAENGGKGQSKNKAGRHAEARLVNVPVGTVIRDELNNRQYDLLRHEQQVLICRGGDGGLGNSHFKSRFCSAPDRSTPGIPGEEKELVLTLKLMADVGLLGFPNAGKSTLLSRLSNAKPKVADYPFTTLKPSVGVCEIDLGRTMVVADIPGLIEGASQGIGLGARFLRHLERVNVLCHLLDAFDEADLLKRYETINAELKNYSEKLFSLPQIVAINKIDAVDEEGMERIKAFEDFLQAHGVMSFRISAVNGAGMPELITELYKRVKKLSKLEEGGQENATAFNPLDNLY